MIESVKIKNLGPHESTELEIREKVALFVGGSEQGKSFIREGTRWCLDEIWLDEESFQAIQKKEQGALIRSGQKKAEVEVVMGGKPLIRTRTAASSTGIHSSKLPPEVLSCLCNSTYYGRMDPRARAKMLFDLLGLDIDLKTIKEDYARDFDLLDDDIMVQVQSGFVKGFDGAKNKVVEMRRYLKRQLSDLPTQAPKDEVTVTYHKDGEEKENKFYLPEQDADKIKTALAGVEKDRDGLVEERGKLEGKQKGSLEWIRGEAKAKRERIEPLEKRLAEASDSAQDLISLDERLDVVRKEIEATRANIRLLEGKLEAIPEYEDDKCQTCGRKLTKAMVDDLKRDRKKLGSDLESKRLIHENQHTELQGLDEKRGEIARGQGEYTRFTNELAMTKKELTRLETSEKEAESFTLDEERLAEIAVELDNADNRIRAYHDLIRAIETYERKAKAYNEAAVKGGTFESQIEALNNLDEAFGPGPGGIRAKLTAEARGQVNEVLAIFEGLLGRKVELDEELALRFSDNHIEALLSKSARRRVGIAMQAAIAELSGFKFMAVDDSENLDPGLRSSLATAALKLAKARDIQTWIFAAVGQLEIERLEQMLPVDGLQVFRIQGGVVQELREKKAA